jgi:exonuclease III
MYFEADYGTAVQNENIIWVGGVNIYRQECDTKDPIQAQENYLNRLRFPDRPYDYVDPTTGKALNDMTPDEFQDFKMREMDAQKQLHATFIQQLGDAVEKGLY